jgi:rhodanese-related sulfurtransferase
MRPLLRWAVPLIMLVAAGWVMFGQSTNQIAPDKAIELMKSQQNLIVLDVRTAGEYAGGHLVGAINIDVTKSDFEQRIARLDKKKPVLVYCAVGGRSASATKTLVAKGFTVHDLVGGFSRWQREGRPSER